MDSDISDIPYRNNKLIEIVSMKYEQENKIYDIEFKNHYSAVSFEIIDESKPDDIYYIKLTAEDFYKMNKIMRFCLNIEDIIEFLRKKIEKEEVTIMQENDNLSFCFYLINQRGESEPVKIELIKNKKSTYPSLSNEANQLQQLKYELDRKENEIKTFKREYDKKFRKIEERIHELSLENTERIKTFKGDYRSPFKKTQQFTRNRITNGTYYDPGYENDPEHEYEIRTHRNPRIKNYEVSNGWVIPWSFRFKKGPNYNLYDGYIATKTSDGLWDATVLGDKYLSKNKLNIWKIRINKQFFGGGIIIGIAQSGISQKKANNFENVNAYFISTWTLKKGNKGIWNNYGNGRLKDGDIVEVIADLRNNTLRFGVNGHSLGTAFDNLSNDVKYIPFIEMYNRGNEIELIESKVH